MPAPGPMAPPGPMPPEPPWFEAAQASAPVPRSAPALPVLGLVLAFVMPLAGLILSIIATVRAGRAGRSSGIAVAGIVVSVITPILVAATIPVILNSSATTEAHAPEVAGGDAPVRAERPSPRPSDDPTLSDDDRVRHAWERVGFALTDVDCATFRATTTTELRIATGVTTCRDFELFAADGPLWPDDAEVVHVEVDGDAAILTTIETELWGDDAPREQAYEYTFIRRDGVWLMDLSPSDPTTV